MCCLLSIHQVNGTAMNEAGPMLLMEHSYFLLIIFLKTMSLMQILCKTQCADIMNYKTFIHFFLHTTIKMTQFNVGIPVTFLQMSPAFWVLLLEDG